MVRVIPARRGTESELQLQHQGKWIQMRGRPSKTISPPESVLVGRSGHRGSTTAGSYINGAMMVV